MAEEYEQEEQEEELDQDDVDYATCDKVDKMFEEAKSYRDRLDDEAREHHRFYNGIQWQNDVERRPFVNAIFKTVESEVPILTDSRPGTDIVSIEEERSDDARVMKEAIDYVYLANDLDLKTPQAVRTSLISGTGFLYVDWDPELEKGLGQVVIRNMPWKYVYLDPSNGELDRMSHIHIRYPEKIAAIKRMFKNSDAADKVVAEDVEIDDDDILQMYRVESQYSGPNSTKTSIYDFKPADMAYIHECYFKDYSMEKIPEEDTLEQASKEVELIQSGGIPELSKYMDHAKIIEILEQERMAMIGQASGEQGAEPGDPAVIELNPDLAVMNQMFLDLIEQHQVFLQDNPNGERPKYPNNIRLVVKVQKNILYDGPPPVDDGLYPIVPIYCYKLEDKPYGVSEVKNILPLQKCINELNWSDHRALRLVSNPGWIKDDTSLVDDDTLTNEEGIVITKKQGTECRRLEAGQVNPQVSVKINQYEQWIQEVSGINESIVGERPRGVVAAKAISQIQTQSLARIRLKSRGIDNSSMVRLGKLCSSRIIKYWKSQRILKNYDDNGRISTLVFDPERLQDFNYQVRVSPGSTVGMSKEYILAQSQELLAAGVIDPEIFVMMNDLPYKNLILSKLQEKNQMAQQAQALAAENSELKTLIEQLTGNKAGEAVAGTSQGGTPVPGTEPVAFTG